MTRGRVLKIIGFLLLGALLLVGAVIFYFYYQTQWKHASDEEKYPHYIGYLSKSDDNPGFTRCDENFTFGWYASAATYTDIYHGSKASFKKFIKENFQPEPDSGDNGFLNLRFIINCKGEVGNVEIIELGTDYRPKKLSPELVDQLVSLSSKSENWKVAEYDDEPVDSYMYLIFKIEDGKVSEILP